MPLSPCFSWSPFPTPNEKSPHTEYFRCAGILYCARRFLVVVVIDADHDGRCLDDRVRILADLKTELFDGV